MSTTSRYPHVCSPLRGLPCKEETEEEEKEEEEEEGDEEGTEMRPRHFNVTSASWPFSVFQAGNS